MKKACMAITVAAMLALGTGGAQAAQASATVENGTIAAGANNNAVITTDGTLYTWGQNTHGQLGDGTTKDSATPLALPGRHTGVSVQGTHMIALDGAAATI